MDEQNSGFILCDISFNGQLTADVKLPRACSMSNIVQGLWLDDNFRKTGLAYLKAKDEKQGDGKTGSPLKSYGGIDRCILRAYVAIRIMPAWKWLEFKDFIVDFENKKDCYTVGDVLGTLCTGLHKPVLRIVPKNENEADDQEVKSIVNELLKTRSIVTFAAADCPLSNGMLSLIAQGKYTSTIGQEKCQAFIRWLRRQDLTSDSLANPEPQVSTPKPNALLPSSQQKQGKNLKPRITFTQHDTDNLNEWFNKDERPSKEVMQHYTDILNIPREIASLRLLQPESIHFWFKNKRSKKRKLEMSHLEPWEQENEMSESGATPQVTMAIEGTPQTTVTTGDVSIVTSPSTGESSSGLGTQVNGLTTMVSSFEDTPGKPRKIPKSRITFDPETELSQLNAWFDDSERPDKDIIEEYTNILNEVRAQKSKRLLSSENIAMWFKNKKAKKRRGEGNFFNPLENSKSEFVQDTKEEHLTCHAAESADTTMEAEDLRASLSTPTFQDAVPGVISTDSHFTSGEIITNDQEDQKKKLSLQ